MQPIEAQLNGGVSLTEVIFGLGLVKSRKDARLLARMGAIRINGEVIDNSDAIYELEKIKGASLRVRREAPVILGAALELLFMPMDQLRSLNQDPEGYSRGPQNYGH